jgi:hypothetical protein
MIHPSSAHQRSAAGASHSRGPASAEGSLEKRSLAKILRDHGPLRVTDAVDLVLDVCDELSYAHMNGVVHGDLGVHRVRTAWPRSPGQAVDLFALAETDTAAFEFRASAGGIILAPEQRLGLVVDSRVDVFAVGVMLHWLITGVAPGYAPLSHSLAGVPRPVALTIEACLAEDPAWRPASVDDIAEAIGSFSAFPPERFAQIASRRGAAQSTCFVRKGHADVGRTLGRLDEAALSREVSAASALPSSAAPTQTLVMVSVQSVFSKAPTEAQPARAPMRSYHPADDAPTKAVHDDAPDSQAAVETLPSHAQQAEHAPSYDDYPMRAPRAAFARTVPSDAYVPPPASVGGSSAVDPVEVIRQRVPSVPSMAFDSPGTVPPPRRSPWSSMLGFVAIAAVVAFGVLVVARLSDRAKAEGAAVLAAQPVQTLPMVPALATQAPVAAPVATAANAPAAKGASVDPPVMTPSALPDARAGKRAGAGRSSGSSSSPRSKSTTGARAASRDIATPSTREAGSSSHAAPPSTREAAPSEDFTVTSSALSDALR